MIIYRQKIFGGNRENKAKKKEWEAKSGREKYKELTWPGTDMGANEFPSSREVIKKRKELIEDPGKARGMHRDLRDWDRNKFKKINSEIFRDSRKHEISPCWGESYYTDHYKRVSESIPKITEKHLKESHIQRIKKHNPSRVVEEVKKVTTPSAKATKSKSVLKSIGSLFKKFRA